jgi:type II secretory pathway pseudopilin PulG
MYVCPECESEINQASELCPYCGADLTPRGAAPGQVEKKSSVVRRLFLWAIVLAMLWGIAWLAVPWRMSDSKSAAEARAREALASLQSALIAYQTSERSFPQTLEPLGDRARQAAQAAQSVHYTLQYSPGMPDSDGRVKSYTLLARAGNFGYLNFYLDESGVLHATAEDRPATVQDQTLKPSS